MNKSNMKEFFEAMKLLEIENGIPAGMLVEKIRQSIQETTEPKTEASPIGNSVCGKQREARYAPGMRMQKLEITLCRKESADFLRAQK